MDKIIKITIKDCGECTIEQEETTIVEVENTRYGSKYARFFDESCPSWNTNPERNLMFLRMQEQWANDLLKSRGHLFLNEVYDILGIARSREGQVVGWIYDENNPTGDNYVDFGIGKFNKSNLKIVDKVNKTGILLDFNVDGDILKCLGEEL